MVGWVLEFHEHRSVWYSGNGFRFGESRRLQSASFCLSRRENRRSHTLKIFGRGVRCSVDETGHPSRNVTDRIGPTLFRSLDVPVSLDGRPATREVPRLRRKPVFEPRRGMSECDRFPSVSNLNSENYKRDFFLRTVHCNWVLRDNGPSRVQFRTPSSGGRADSPVSGRRTYTRSTHLVLRWWWT